MLFVNLPLHYIAQSPRYLDHFIGARRPWPAGYRFGPELGLDALSMQRRPREWHEQVAARLRAADVTPSLHLPFFELSAGALDEHIRRATVLRLREAMELARVYRPAHMVGHPLYIAAIHEKHKELWLENSLQSWTEILDSWPEHPPLFLENTHELEPEPLLELVRALQPRKVKICFDVGHWRSFAQGAQRDNLADWLDALGPLLGHLHLHDNDGSDDLHQGLGHGSIPWVAFFEQLKKRSLRPSATFEPHTEEAMAVTLAFMRDNPSLFSGFRNSD